MRADLPAGALRFSRRDPGAVPHIVSVLQQEELPAVVAAARNISVHQATEEIHVEKIGQAGENNTLRKDVLFRMHRVRHRHIFRHGRAALQELKSGIGRQCGTQGLLCGGIGKEPVNTHCIVLRVPAPQRFEIEVQHRGNIALEAQKFIRQPEQLPEEGAEGFVFRRPRRHGFLELFRRTPAQLLQHRPVCIPVNIQKRKQRKRIHMLQSPV